MLSRKLGTAYVGWTVHLKQMEAMMNQRSFLCLNSDQSLKQTNKKRSTPPAPSSPSTDTFRVQQLQNQILPKKLFIILLISKKLYSHVYIYIYIFKKAAAWQSTPETGCWHDNMVQTFLFPRQAVNNHQISLLTRASTLCLCNAFMPTTPLTDGAH